MKAKKLYIISYLKRIPKHSNLTHVKDYGLHPDAWQYDEEVHVARSLRKSDIDMASVILNVSEKKAIKRGPNTSATYDELYQYFVTNYPQYIQLIDRALGNSPAAENVAVEEKPAEKAAS